MQTLYVAHPGRITRLTSVVYGTGALQDATFTPVMPGDPDVALAVRATHTGCGTVADPYLVEWYAAHFDERVS